MVVVANVDNVANANVNTRINESLWVDIPEDWKGFCEVLQILCYLYIFLSSYLFLGFWGMHKVMTISSPALTVLRTCRYQEDVSLTDMRYFNDLRVKTWSGRSNNMELEAWRAKCWQEMNYINEFISLWEASSHSRYVYLLYILFALPHLYLHN